MNGTAIGFMSLSTDVDLGVLLKCFELEPFNGLKTVRAKQMPRKEGKRWKASVVFFNMSYFCCNVER